MALLEGVAWEGKVFKGGAWTEGRGGTYPVVEPATGNELTVEEERAKLRLVVETAEEVWG